MHEAIAYTVMAVALIAFACMAISERIAKRNEERWRSTGDYDEIDRG